MYEADIIVLTRAGYIYEVEIKTSLADLKADFKKKRFHNDSRIKYMWYAIPKNLFEKAESLIPEWAGIFVIKPRQGRKQTKEESKELEAIQIRLPKCRSQYKATKNDRAVLTRLAALRIWGLKKKIADLERKLNEN